jgi:iron complex outermembrane receptor protein
MSVCCFESFRAVYVAGLVWATCVVSSLGLSAQARSSDPCGGASSSAATFGDLLQGRVAGVTVTQNGATAMGASRIRIRGINSIHAKNPLIFIDDIRVTPAGYSGWRGLHAVPLLEMVDPSTISRVEVLRGPAATIQYSDASDGVIRIYTRRGDEKSAVQRVDCEPVPPRP